MHNLAVEGAGSRNSIVWIQVVSDSKSIVILGLIKALVELVSKQVYSVTDSGVVRFRPGDPLDQCKHRWIDRKRSRRRQLSRKGAAVWILILNRQQVYRYRPAWIRVSVRVDRSVDKRQARHKGR